MRLTAYTLSVFTIVLLSLIDLTAKGDPLSDRIANYNMVIELDTATKRLDAFSEILWKNLSTDTITKLQFHLYYNAFKNTESTFMLKRDMFADMMDGGLQNDCKWSWTEITSLTDTAGNELTNEMHFIAPDDGNPNDQTVLEVPLAIAVLPGEQIELKMKWEAKIPGTMPRTGHNKDFYFMVQWFPKLGVYEAEGVRNAPAGRWNCHQYHSKGEYYADFGVYDVAIKVPKGFKLGGSGELVSMKEEGEMNVWKFHAEDIIDFAWTASPHFEIQKNEWEGVKINLFTYPEHAYLADRYLNTIKSALSYMSEHLMKYPYPELTIVNPPIHGMYSGAMEYPTLITAMGLSSIPKGIKILETLTVHEFIHQYFMQMVASHEVEEPWMDEGFTTFYEGRVLDNYMGEQNSTIDLLGINVGNKEYNRIEFFGESNPKIASNNRRSWQFKHGGYGPVSYNKTAIWLNTLEGLVGIESMDEIMHTYFHRWKFKHPCGANFEEVVDEVVAKNHSAQFENGMKWFFDQVLRSTETCDYTVASISNELIRPKAGFFKLDENCLPLKNVKDGEAQVKSTVILNRLGELKFPVDVAIHFSNGETINKIWDGIDRSFDYSFEGDYKITSVEIDPERKIYIDKNFINNSKVVKPEQNGIRKYLVHFMTSLQSIMTNISAFI